MRNIPILFHRSLLLACFQEADFSFLHHSLRKRQLLVLSSVLTAYLSWIMAADAGPPQGEIKFMTPFPVGDDPPPSKPIPDITCPEKTLAERAAARFSLAEKKAIGGKVVAHLGAMG